MTKLKKADFDKKFRFRESRIEKHQKNLVNCVSCTSISGGITDKELAYCNHSERFRRIKIAKYWESWVGLGTTHNISYERVCDAHTPHSLPEGVQLPIINNGQAIVLGTQWRDIYHASSTCPYVVEEARMIHVFAQTKEGDNEHQFNKAKIETRDISDLVPEETIGSQVCEMPCCDSKLPYHTWRVDDYRRKVGIKPDGTEKKPWVRKVVAHERKVIMTPEQAFAFFDLSKFSSPDFNPGFGQIHDRIIAVADYLHKNCNSLGSRPLSEAVNPVFLCPYFHFLDERFTEKNSDADVWVYDERLFDIQRGLEKPIGELEKIPEGIIPCMDTYGILKTANSYCRREYYFSPTCIRGIIKPLEDKNLLSKGLTHFVEINEINSHAHEHMWGEFGRGFNGLASFHEE